MWPIAAKSPAIDIIELLHKRNAHIDYADPYIPTVTLPGTTLTAVPLDDDHVKDADCVVIVTDHSTYDYAYLARTAALIIDTRNATSGIAESHIRRL